MASQPSQQVVGSEKIEAKFDLSIALTLSAWTALSLAVQNSWGGPNSADKRDWFAGAISELIEATPDVDAEYLEEFLLQVMIDEFDVNLEDGSAAEVAEKIIGLRKLTLQRDFALVDEMHAKWEERQRRGGNTISAQFVGGDGEESDGDSSEEEDDDDDDDDVEMDEAPELVRVPKEKPPLEVDEDGFTKVAGRRKR